MQLKMQVSKDLRLKNEVREQEISKANKMLL
jgi:hypothetical protein